MHIIVASLSAPLKSQAQLCTKHESDALYLLSH